MSETPSFIPREPREPREPFDWRKLPVYLWKLIRKNLGYKIVALMIAMVLWSGLISQDATLMREKIMTDVTANITGSDSVKRNGFIVTSSMDELVSGLTVRASVPQTQYQTATAANYNLRLDLSRIRSAGKQVANIIWTNSSTYGNIIDVTPSAVELTVDEYITRFRIPVVLETTGALPSGWWASTATLDPPLVAISGPRELLETIVRAGAVLDLSRTPQEEGTILTTVPFSLVNNRGETVKSDLITVSSESVLLDTIIAEQTVYPEKVLNFSGVGLVTGTPKDGYEVKAVTVSPESLVAAGPQDTLSEINSIFTERHVDVSGKSESFTQVLRLNKPSELAYLSQDTVTVAVTIGEIISTRTFKDLRITTASTLTDRNVTFANRTASVEVIGPKNWLDSLRAGQIQLTVDPVGLDSGVYDLPIRVTIQNSDTVEYDVMVVPETVSTTVRLK